MWFLCTGRRCHYLLNHGCVMSVVSCPGYCRPWRAGHTGMPVLSQYLWPDIQHHLVWDVSLFAGQGLVAVLLSSYCTVFSLNIKSIQI